MGENTEPSEVEPITVSDWFSAIVHTPSRWDIALALVPLAIVFGVLLGGTQLPMWIGVALGTGVALAALSYVVAVTAPVSVPG